MCWLGPTAVGVACPIVPAPPTAPLPRRSELETFRYSRRHGLATMVRWSVPAFLLRTPGGDPTALGGCSLRAHHSSSSKFFSAKPQCCGWHGERADGLTRPPRPRQGAVFHRARETKGPRRGLGTGALLPGACPRQVAGQALALPEPVPRGMGRSASRIAEARAPPLSKQVRCAKRRPRTARSWVRALRAEASKFRRPADARLVRSSRSV
jgi:hypothetical protein